MHKLPTTLLTLLPIILTLTNAGLPPREHFELECSPDHNPKVTPTDFSSQDLWKSQMLSCMQKLDTDQWNGAECQPMTADNSAPLGPAFGFWKGEERHNKPEDAKNCYQYCMGCLARGIMAGKAVTTSCYHRNYGLSYGPGVQWSCTMGFDWKGYAGVSET